MCFVCAMTGGRAAGVLHRGDKRNEEIEGGRGDDLLFGRGGDDLVKGFQGDDLIVGGAGSDRMLGGHGEDLIRGGAGDDVIRGGQGADLIYGGRGGDRLIGGRGPDTLKGGEGADVYVFNQQSGADRIVDFDEGEDRILVSQGAEDFDDLTISSSDRGAVVSFGETEIHLRGVDAQDVNRDSFVFAAGDADVFAVASSPDPNGWSAADIL